MFIKRQKDEAMYKYLTICERLFNEEVGTYTSYGIICINCESETVVSQISDVSLSRDFVINLSEKFTQHALAPIHFLDAVEDAL